MDIKKTIPGALRTPDAARYVGCAPHTLEHWRWQKTGPRFVKASHRFVVYRIADLDDWLANREQESAAA